MRERDIERKLVSAAKRRSGLALKLASPGMAGMPDRLVLLPHSRVGFVEVKAPGKKPRPLQEAVHRWLRDLGFLVFVLDNPEKVEEILDEIEKGGAHDG